MAPERIADLVEEMSNGQMKITVYGAEEQVPAFGVFDAVSSGSHQMGHSGGYFWKGKVKIEIAVAKGKKLYDKRQVKKTRDWNREKARLLSKNNK